MRLEKTGTKAQNIRTKFLWLSGCDLPAYNNQVDEFCELATSETALSSQNANYAAFC